MEGGVLSSDYSGVPSLAVLDELLRGSVQRLETKLVLGFYKMSEI